MDGQGDSIDAIINALLSESGRSIWDNSSVPVHGNTSTGRLTVDLSRNQWQGREYHVVEDSAVGNIHLQNQMRSEHSNETDSKEGKGNSGGLSQDEKRKRNREIQARYRQRQRELRLQTEQKYEEMMSQLQQARLENQREKMKLEILGKLLTVRSTFVDMLEKTAVNNDNDDDNNGNMGQQGYIVENVDTNASNNKNNNNTGKECTDASLQVAGNLAVEELERQQQRVNSAVKSVGVQIDGQTGETREPVQPGASSGLVSIRKIAREIRQCVEENMGGGRKKDGYDLAQADAIVAGIRRRVASEEYAEQVASAISNLRVEEFHHFLSKFASTSRMVLLEAGIPMNRVCLYEDKSYDAKRKLVVQKIMPIYSEFLVHAYGTAKYRPRLMLRFLSDAKTPGKVLLRDMSPVVQCLHFSEEQKQSILDARDQCCSSRNARLAIMSEKYLVLQKIFECSDFDSMQAMTSRYLELFDGTGRFIESALDDLELNEVIIWMAKMGRTMGILQKCVMFGMSHPQLPNVVQIPDFC